MATDMKPSGSAMRWPRSDLLAFPHHGSIAGLPDVLLEAASTSTGAKGNWWIDSRFRVRPCASGGWMPWAKVLRSSAHHSVELLAPLDPACPMSFSLRSRGRPGWMTRAVQRSAALTRSL
jgi:hypothetical protein